MVALVVLIVGLFCLLFGVVVQDKHQHFLRRSNKVFGRVVGYSSIENITSVLKHPEESPKTYSLPIVEYEYGKTYRFIADEEYERENFVVGEAIEVYVDKLNPKIAKLKQGTSQTETIMRIFLAIGVIFCAFGLYIFDLHDITQLINGEKFYLLVSVALFSYVGAKLTPILRLAFTSPIYHENAFEVSDSDSIK
ncbi:DUF3592 domain-containing protein [Thalassotalea fusca]